MSRNRSALPGGVLGPGGSAPAATTPLGNTSHTRLRRAKGAVAVAGGDLGRGGSAPAASRAPGNSSNTRLRRAKGAVAVAGGDLGRGGSAPAASRPPGKNSNAVVGSGGGTGAGGAGGGSRRSASAAGFAASPGHGLPRLGLGFGGRLRRCAPSSTPVGLPGGRGVLRHVALRDGESCPGGLPCLRGSSPRCGATRSFFAFLYVSPLLSLLFSTLRVPSLSMARLLPLSPLLVLSRSLLLFWPLRSLSLSLLLSVFLSLLVLLSPLRTGSAPTATATTATAKGTAAATATATPTARTIATATARATQEQPKSNGSSNSNGKSNTDNNSNTDRKSDSDSDMNVNAAIPRRAARSGSSGVWWRQNHGCRQARSAARRITSSAPRKRCSATTPSALFQRWHLPLVGTLASRRRGPVAGERVHSR